MAERNINFNEAKKLGLVAPNKIAEQETLQAAGGEKAFRPESWWNKQLTTQVNAKKFQEVSGSSLQVKSSGIFGSAGGWVDAPMGVGGYQQPQSYGFGQQPKEGVDYRYVPTYKDVTIDVLKAITKQSKGQVEQAQRTSGEMKARNKRLARVTGGLLAGVQTPGASTISTGPQLGGDDSLGNDSMLGRRTRI
jgi:hypothetical protein